MAKLALQIAQLIYSLLVISVSAQDGYQRDDLDPHYAPIENQFLIFPMLEKDYWNWGSAGSAVFLS